MFSIRCGGLCVVCSCELLSVSRYYLVRGTEVNVFNIYVNTHIYVVYITEFLSARK